MTSASTPKAPVAVKPPHIQVGPLAWLRDNLFYSIPSAILTIVMAVLSALAVWKILQFGVFQATWIAKDGADCRLNDGACWPYVFAKFSQFMYGTYPEELRWRPDLVYVLGVGALVPMMFDDMKTKLRVVGIMIAVSAIFVALKVVFQAAYPQFLGFSSTVDPLFLAAFTGVPLLTTFLSSKIGRTPFVVFFFAMFPFIAFFLLVGTFWAPDAKGPLEFVSTRAWGGMLITLVVATVGIVAAFPISIALALGRRSKMPFIRWVSVTFIEVVRGIPLVLILFVSSVVLPLFLPPGVEFDSLLRALIMVTLFSAAYLAEVIRGGLQAIPRGQFEAADALGLSYFQKTRLIVMPQALKLVIPGIVNSFIGLFKDTSLVLIIGLFDLLGIVQKNFTDSKWYAPSTVATGYLFVGFLFWIFCFGMSRYSLKVEREMAAGDRR